MTLKPHPQRRWKEVSKNETDGGKLTWWEIQSCLSRQESKKYGKKKRGSVVLYVSTELFED